MAKNKRRRRYQHPLAYIPKPVSIGFVAVVSLALVYLWIGHKCSQYSEEIKRLDNQSADLDNERIREQTKWDAMKSADKLDQLLVRHGLMMSYPTAAQVVRVGPGGAVATSPALAQQTPGATRGATRVAGSSRANH
jgi:hypothetical protein